MKPKFFLSTIGKKFQNPQALRVELFFETAPSTFEATVAPLKYNKKWAFSFSLDDGYVDAYSNVFAIFYGGIPDLNNVTHPGRFFTDGCGNDIMYKSGFAGPLVDENGVDFHHENQTAYVKWSQYEFATDFGFDMIYQQYGQPAIGDLVTYQDFLNDTVTGRNYVLTKLGFKPLFGTCNNGNTGWINNEGKCPLYDAGCLVVGFNNTSATVAGQVISLETGYNLDTITKQAMDAGIIMRRSLLNEATIVLQDIYDTMAAISGDSARRWLHYFTHRVTYTEPPGSANISVATFQSIMDHLHNTYGKAGLDNVWMAAPSEVYEYIYARESAVINKYYEGNKVILEIVYDSPNDHRRPCLTLNINSNLPCKRVDVYNIVRGTTNLVNATSGMVNLDWSGEIEAVADKFVTRAETTTYQEDIDYAQFMVNQITDLAIKTPLQARINAIEPYNPVSIRFLFDFGISGFWEMGNPWNRVTSADVGVKLTQLRDSDNNLYNYGIEVTDAFAAVGTVGNTPTPADSGLYPDKALKDSINTTTSGDSSGTFKMTGLDNAKKYDFIFLANKSNLDTTTKYTIGATSVTLFGRDNYTNTVRIDNVSPTNGEIFITVTNNTNSQQGHLNVMEMIEHS